jgi:hypothetical protein
MKGFDGAVEVLVGIFDYHTWRIRTLVGKEPEPEEFRAQEFLMEMEAYCKQL